MRPPRDEQTVSRSYEFDAVVDDCEECHAAIVTYQRRAIGSNRPRRRHYRRCASCTAIAFAMVPAQGVAA